MQELGLLAKPKLVTVDMSKELKEHGLFDHFPHKCWPPSDAVSQLATWAKAARKHKSERAYVFVDLKRSFSCHWYYTCFALSRFRFLPAKCPEHVTCKAIDEECGEKPSSYETNKDAKLKDRKLDWGYWNVAWLRYSLAAVATGQMSMSQCQAHAATVLDVAALAPAQGKSAWLGVLYDELVRHLMFDSSRWPCNEGLSILPGKNGPTFRESWAKVLCWMTFAES
jgi:hypothetical protein